MTTERPENQPENQAPPKRCPGELTDCGEHPVFAGGPMPAGEDPPLEGELVCVCGQAEGLHRSDGSCEASGCVYFVPADACEDETRPDIRIEYDVGQEPL